MEHADVELRPCLSREGLLQHYVWERRGEGVGKSCGCDLHVEQETLADPERTGLVDRVLIGRQAEPDIEQSRELTLDVLVATGRQAFHGSVPGGRLLHLLEGTDGGGQIVHLLLEQELGDRVELRVGLMDGRSRPTAGDVRGPGSREAATRDSAALAERAEGNDHDSRFGDFVVAISTLARSSAAARVNIRPYSPSRAATTTSRSTPCRRPVCSNASRAHCSSGWLWRILR